MESGAAGSVQSSESEVQHPGRHSNRKRPSCLTNVIRASQIKQYYLSTGCKVLDEFLQGGIPGFGITEISGEASCGKTQISLQLSLLAQLPISDGGLNGGSIYINTEQFFPSNRLFELNTHFKAKYGPALPENPMDRILVEHISDSDTLIKCIDSRLPALLRDKAKNIRLVVLDSIASVFRAEYDKNDMKRIHDIRLVGVGLHKLYREFNVTVVVVNQVSASFSLGENIPSLGLTWTNLVTTRLMRYR